MLNESVKFGHLMIEDERILYIDDDFFIMYDGFPTSPGHTLIITNGPERDYFELSQSKKNKLSLMLDKAKEIIEGEYSQMVITLE
jgi:diadenosine tetraphosphate (Ap4A) HIT family hydrolase